MFHMLARCLVAALFVAGQVFTATRPAAAQSSARKPADSVQLITSDLPNFWRAYDSAATRAGSGRSAAFQTLYLQPSSPGLRDWIRLRLTNRDTVRAWLIAAGWNARHLDSLYRLPRGTPGKDSLERAMQPLDERSAAEELVRALDAYPRYYAAVRAATLSLATNDSVTRAIRRGLERLTELYPLYNGMVPPDKNDGAVDIGYWVGAQIAHAYYERARDKQAAVRELILLAEPERLLAESGYAEYAEGLPEQ